MNARWFFHNRTAVPLGVRLALTLLLVTAVSMALLTSVILFGVSTYESSRRAAMLEGQADFYAALATELVAGNGDLQAITQILINRSAGSGDIAVRIFGTAGQIFGASGSSAPFPSRTAANLLSTSVPQVLLSEDTSRRYSARKIMWNGKSLGVIEVSQSTAEEQRLLFLLWRVVGQSTLIALIAAVVGSIFVARWLARLIRRLRTVAERVAAGDLTERAVEHGPDEIIQLTRALNSMADQLAERLARIEGQSETQRRFYRDISHELRTPLMALGGYLENVEDAAAGPEQATAIAAMQREIGRLARLADELLRPDSAPTIAIGPGKPVDLRAMIAELAANLAGRARRGGVELHSDLPEHPIVVAGDHDRLKQALLNLLDNALRAVPPGGAITISGRGGPGFPLGRGGAAALIDIVDTGPGIPEHLREAVWERGVRGTEGGSGLGLAIVRSIIEAHGGTATLVPGDNGAHIRIALPQKA